MKQLSRLQNIQVQVVDASNMGDAHKLIHDRLKNHNTCKIGAYDKQEFCFVCYDDGVLVAGLYAYLSFGNFYIDILWVDENYHTLGIGTRLLNIAEKHAINNDALYIRVNTGSFQAPAFYLKNGYQQFAKLPIIVPNKTEQYDYYFVKYLTRNK